MSCSTCPVDKKSLHGEGSYRGALNVDWVKFTDCYNLLAIGIITVPTTKLGRFTAYVFYRIAPPTTFYNPIHNHVSHYRLTGD